MTNEEARKIAIKLFEEASDKESEIREKAKRQGKLKPGLDGNAELYKAIKEELREKLKELADQVTE